MAQTFPVSLMKARDGSYTAQAAAPGQTGAICLHSSVSPAKEAKDWCDRIELQPYTMYAVLGGGLGYHVKELLKRLPEGCYIYVIDYPTFSESAEDKSIPWYHLKKNDKVIVFKGSTIRDISARLAGIMREKKLRRVTLCYHYPSMALAPELYQTLEKELSVRAGFIFTTDINYLLAGMTNGLKCFWNNLPYIATSPGIQAFSNAFQGKPCIIVSAGPSLDKSIPVLKEYADKALLIASGSAMGALMKHGIVPHILMLVDPFMEMAQALKDRCHPDTLLMASYKAADTAVEFYPGKRCFFNVQEDLLFAASFHDVLPKTDNLLTSISVATSALSLAVKVRAEPIVFVGQDLAFTGGRSHAEGVNTVSFLETTGHEYIEVLGQDGNMLQTVQGLRDTLNFMESYIKVAKQQGAVHNFINCSEGGAFIHGTEHMPLAQAVKQFSIEEDFSFKAAVENLLQSESLPSIEPLFRRVCKYEASAEKMAEELAKVLTETEGMGENHNQVLNKFVELERFLTSQEAYVIVAPAIEGFAEIWNFQLRDDNLSMADKAFGQRHYFNIFTTLLTALQSLIKHARENLEEKVCQQ